MHTTTTTSMANDAEKKLSFPGADSGKGRAWEDRIKVAVRLLPERDGHRPGVVLEARAPAKLTMTAVQVSMSERQLYGSNYIGVADSNGRVTPRKLASSLATPAPGLYSRSPSTPGISSSSGVVLQGFANPSASSGGGSSAQAAEADLMPVDPRRA